MTSTRTLSSGLLRSASSAVDRTLPVSARRRLRYLVMHRKLLSLRRPVTFTEKVQWRMVHDRRELIAPTCDKLWMKAHVEAAGLSQVRVPATYWSGTDVGELADVDLPDRWVLKPNHRYGLVHLGSGVPDVEHLRRLTAGWLEEPRSLRGEWAYSRARQCLVVEEMIGAEAPVDYKFFVFEGDVRLIQMSTELGASGRARRLYTADWQPAGGTGELLELAPRPPLLEEMLAVASSLGAPFDFIRVDLYDVDGQVWFGELTPYPASGLRSFDPAHLDAELGRAWRLPQGEGIL